MTKWNNLFIFAFLINSTALAASNAVVTSTSCQKLNHPAEPFILVLKKGQDLIPAITQCLKDAAVSSAAFTGVGALKNPVLAYYDLKHSKYHNKKFAGLYELVSLTGNLSSLKDKPMAHFHAGLGNEKYKMIAGHLQSAEVGVTAEITVVPFKEKIERKMDAETGLNLISD